MSEEVVQDQSDSINVVTEKLEGVHLSTGAKPKNPGRVTVAAASLYNNDPDPTLDGALVSPGKHARGHRKRQTKMTAFLTSSSEPGPGGSSRNGISENGKDDSHKSTVAQGGRKKNQAKEKEKKSKKRNLEVGTDSSCDFYIVSHNSNTKWENEVLEGLQKKKSGVKCLSSKDSIPGKYKVENMLESLKRCKKLVVGYTSQQETGTQQFVVATALQQVLDSNTLDQGKIIPVRITEDAAIPAWLRSIDEANFWEEEFYDNLLKALSEQEMEESKRGLGNGEDETEFSVTEIPADKLQHENGKYVWKPDGEDDLEVDISSPILEDNVTQLMALEHGNVEMFQCLTRMPPDSHLVGVYTSQNRTLKDVEFDDKQKKQKAVIGITSGLKFLHEKGIKHGNLNTSTVVVNREGHAMIRDFNFTTVPDGSDLKAKLMFLAPDIEGFATVIWHVLTGKEILYNGKKRKEYKLPDYKKGTKKTTRFFIACLDDDLEKRPPVLEVWYWWHGFFDLLLPNTDNQPSSFRLKKNKPETLICKSCPKKKRLIKEELAVAHKQPYKHYEGGDVHYCAHIKCIRKKFPSFDGRISYDLHSNPVVTIEDVVTLNSDRGCIYHDEASTGFQTYQFQAT